MSIPVLCGSCEAKLNAPDAAAGKRVKCPKCGVSLQIPTPEPEVEFDVVDDEPKPPAKPKPTQFDDDDARPRKKKPALADNEDEDDHPTPRRKSKRVLLDDEEEEPRPRKKAKDSKQPAAKSKLPLILGIGGGALAVVGVVIWLAFFNGKGNDDAKPGPGQPGGPGPGGQQPDSGLATAPRLQPVSKFQLPGRFVGGTPPVFSSDGRLLSINSDVEQGRGSVWDVTGEPKRAAEFDTSVILAPDGKAVLPIGLSRKILDVTSKQPVGESDEFYSHAVFVGDTTFVWTWNSKVAVRDFTKSGDLFSFEVPGNGFDDVFVTDGGKKLWLFMGHQKFEVECWDIPGKRLLRTVKPEPVVVGEGYTRSGIYRSVSADGALFTADQKSKQRFYDSETGKLLHTLPTGLEGGKSGFLPVGQVYAAMVWRQGQPPETALYDLNAKKVLAVLTGHAATKWGLFLVASPDGKRAVSFSNESEALVYDLSSLKLK